MQYRVTRQFGPNQERDEQSFAQFGELEDAKFLVEKLLEKFVPLKTAVIFRIYTSKGLVQEFNSTTTQPSSTVSTSESSAQGMGSGARAKPTPFSTTLRPSGMPAGWGKKEDEDKKK